MVVGVGSACGGGECLGWYPFRLSQSSFAGLPTSGFDEAVVLAASKN